MPSSYTSSLRLTLPATGELTGTWGTTVNDGITTLLDNAVAGAATITMTAADYTLTTSNGATDEARAKIIILTGTPGAARNVICPAVSKTYIVYNNTTGGFAQTIKTSAGTGISVPNGKTKIVRCDGTNVVEGFDAAGSVDLTGNLSYTGTLTGGTGIVNLGSGQFYKDASGNVGVGTTSPSALLEVSGGNINVRRAGAAAAVVGGRAQGTLASPTAVTSGQFLASFLGAGWNGTSYANGGNLSFAAAENFSGSGSGTDAIFSLAAVGSTTLVERMRLDSSGNLGIGTSSPAQKLDVQGAVNSVQARFGNVAGRGLEIGTSIISGTNDAGSVLNAKGATSGTMIFQTDSTERMRLDSSGNLGLGVTPSAWSASATAIEQKNGVAWYSFGAASNANFVTNAFANSAGNFIYKTTDFATRYQQISGTHLWFTAPSGTAGNAISFATAMTLDANANLNVIGRIRPAGGSDEGTQLNLWTTGGGDGSIAAFQTIFYTGANNARTERMRLDSSGNLGLGTTAPASTLDVKAGTTGAPTYKGSIRTIGGGAASEGGIEIVSSTFSSGYGWRMFGPDLGGGDTPLIFSSRTAAAVWTERMRLDSSGNLGIGTSSPTDKLDVLVAPATTAASGLKVRTASITAQLAITGSTYSNYGVGPNTVWVFSDTNNLALGPYGGAGVVQFVTGGTERMRLDSSGNLGIGTSSPQKKLVVSNAGAVGMEWSPTDYSGNMRQLAYNRNTSAYVALRTEASQHEWYIGGSEFMRLDTSGNLGLGVTPSAWGSGRALEIGGQGSGIWGINSTNFYSLTNTRYDGTNFRYVTTAAATAYQQVVGAHQWYTAPSGTAGNTISFTQAMTLDASGRLAIGATSSTNPVTVVGTQNASYTSAKGIVVDYTGSSTGVVLPIGFSWSGSISNQNPYWGIGLIASNFASGLGELGFYTNGTEKARITSGGNQITYQPAESAQNTSVTLSVANLQAQIITSNAAVTLTLPTGTTLDTYASGMVVDSAFEVTFIATTANAITIGANGNTTVGNLTVSGNTSGTFRFRKTAANTFTVYRVS